MNSFRSMIRIWQVFFIFICLSGILSGQTTEQKDQGALTTPADITTLISLSKELSEGYIDLKDHLDTLEKLEENNNFFQEFRTRFQELAQRINSSKVGGSATYGELVDFRLRLKTMRSDLQGRMEPIDEMLRSVSSMEAEWTKNKSRMSEWNQLLDEAASEKVRSLVIRTEELVDDALKNISKNLELLVADKITGTELELDIYNQISEVEELISNNRVLFTFGESPPLFSSSFESQFNSQIYNSVVTGFSDLQPPRKQFFIDDGWVIMLQIVVFILIAGFIIYFRPVDAKGGDEFTLLQRPFSTAAVISIVTFSVFYSSYPALWHILLMLIGWTAFTRLVSLFVPVGNRRLFVYWLIVSLVLSTIFWYARLPAPLYRIFLVTFSLLGAFIAFRCARKQVAKEAVWFVPVLYYLVCGIFLLSVGLNAVGAADASDLVFLATVRTISFVLIARLAIFILKEGVTWFIYRSPMKESSIFVLQGEHLFSKSLTLIYLMAGFLFCVALLVSWNMFDTPMEAIQGVSSLGVTIGSYKLTLGMVFGAIMIFYGGYFVSWILQTFMKERGFELMNITRDVGESVNKILHYVIMLISIILVLIMMGFSLINLTIIAGSLGIGVGLGLQEIVKNFAAGILVLFERPIRVGDTIEFNGGPCRVKKIGLRSTVVQTKAETEIVIPNNDLIMNPLINWTLSQKRYRLQFPIGVAYQSDVAEVIRIMKECGEGAQGVLLSPEPQVLFMGFGESSLNFEMRVWIQDVKNRRTIQSEINQELDRRFRAAGINIPFNQLDVHLHNNIPQES